MDLNGEDMDMKYVNPHTCICVLLASILLQVQTFQLQKFEKHSASLNKNIAILLMYKTYWVPLMITY